MTYRSHRGFTTKLTAMQQAEISRALKQSFLCQQLGAHIDECSTCSLKTGTYCEEGLGIRKALGRVNQE